MQVLMLLADSTLQNLQTSIYNLCGEETGAITIYKIFWENIDGGIGWLPTATRTSEISTWLFACGFVFWLFVKFWSGKAHNESYQGVVPGVEMLSQGGVCAFPPGKNVGRTGSVRDTLDLQGSLRAVGIFFHRMEIGFK